jgi:F0F1-type ATP synthase membrane subunit b/b'
MATTTAQRRNSARKPGLNLTNDAALLAKVERIRELKTIERAAAEAERERKVLEAELRSAMGDETQIVVRGQVIASLSSQRHSTIVDRETLKLAYPEAYAAVVSEKPYRFVQIASDATLEAILKSL